MITRDATRAACLGRSGDQPGYSLAMNYSAAIKTWGDQVPAAEVVKLAGLRYQDVYNLRQRGLVTTVRGPHGRLLLSRDDALRMLAAAVIAASVVMAFATAFRMLRESGASVGPNGMVTIPFTELPQPERRDPVTGGDAAMAA